MTLSRSLTVALAFLGVFSLSGCDGGFGDSAPSTLPSVSAALRISSDLSASSVAADNLNMDLTWGESYRLSALLLSFQKTHSSATLAEFFDHADLVLSRRDDKARRFSDAATWSYRSYCEQNFGRSSLICSNAGADGMILTPLAEFLVLFKERPDLFSNDLLGASAKKAAYLKAVQETIAYQKSKSWNSGVGTYKTHANCEELDSQGRRQLSFDRLPFNLIAAMGRVQFMTYLASGDSRQLQDAISIAKDLKNWFRSGPNGEIYWPYHYFDSLPEDTSHGAIVLGFIRLLAEHGVVFDQSTIDGLDKTVRYFILGGTDVVMTYIGSLRGYSSSCRVPGANDYYDCRDLALWLSVIRYKNWTDYAKTFIHPDSGSFGLYAQQVSDRYSRAKGYGESCTDDGECSTGSCFAGKICGYKLGYGSGCQRDSDCASGSCYAGKICGNPLGAGSSCTRHHECASGLCSGSGAAKTCL